MLLFFQILIRIFHSFIFQFNKEQNYLYSKNYVWIVDFLPSISLEKKKRYFVMPKEIIVRITWFKKINSCKIHCSFNCKVSYKCYLKVLPFSDDMWCYIGYTTSVRSCYIGYTTSVRSSETSEFVESKSGCYGKVILTSFYRPQIYFIFIIFEIQKSKYQRIIVTVFDNYIYLRICCRLLYLKASRLNPFK